MKISAYYTREGLVVKIGFAAKKAGTRKRTVGRLRNLQLRLPVEFSTNEECTEYQMNLESVLQHPIVADPLNYVHTDSYYGDLLVDETDIDDDRVEQVKTAAETAANWRLEALRRDYELQKEREERQRLIDLGKEKADRISEILSEIFDRDVKLWGEQILKVANGEQLAVCIGDKRLGHCYSSSTYANVTFGKDLDENKVPKGNGGNWSRGEVRFHPELGNIHLTSCSVDSSG